MLMLKMYKLQTVVCIYATQMLQNVKMHVYLVEEES